MRFESRIISFVDDNENIWIETVGLRKDIYRGKWFNPILVGWFCYAVMKLIFGFLGDELYEFQIFFPHAFIE
jgi:hypothetical protein